MSYRHLTDHDRYVIYHMNLYGLSGAEIGRRLGRSRSTISRELRRNGNGVGQYFPELADYLRRQRRQAATSRPRTDDAALMAHVEAKLQTKWSPDEIAGRRKRRASGGRALCGGRATGRGASTRPRRKRSWRRCAGACSAAARTAGRTG